MIPILGCPVLNRGDLLARMLRSIDYPVGKIVIINNGEDAGVAAMLDQFLMMGELPIVVHKPKFNLGVAASWNKIIRENPADYWLLIGNDIELAPGDLSKIDAWVRSNPEYVVAPANWGHSLFAVMPRCIEQVGWFDENFYPAYSEDQDQMYRIKLAGAPWADVSDCRAIHGEPPLWGSSTVWSDPVLTQRCKITQRNNHEYYRQKWGGDPGKETFTRPFNDQALTWNDCPFDLELAEANQNPNRPSLT
jgi:GT2 family glycosyltransferase